MITNSDFSHKQIAVVLFNEGEKLSFQNDNLIVRTADGDIKFQCTCYRLFLILAVGSFSITSVVIQKAKKFGFFIAMMTSGFRTYAVIGAEKDGNTMLKRKQYCYSSLDLAKHITKNKIENQICNIKGNRNKNDCTPEVIQKLEGYVEALTECRTLNEIMAFEGLASRVYFPNYFNNVEWKGRKPRVKHDYVNSALDIGYTILFSFIDALLCSFGFDTFCGVMHTQFYMRKSLVCDIMEPFRCIVEKSIRKAISLKQIKEDDFMLINGLYKLKWENSARYAKIIMMPILEYKNKIFVYIQSYYRSFMKGLPAEQFPFFDMEE